MALSAIEGLIQQARSMPQDEIDKLSAVAMETFQLSEKATDCAFALRQLAFILQASSTEPSLPKKLITQMLQSLAGSGRSGVSRRRQCVLCGDILRELVPSEDLTLQDEKAPVTPNKSVDYLPLYVLQGHTAGCIDKIVPFAMRWVGEQKLDCDVQRKLFVFLVAVETLHKHLLSEAEVGDVNRKVSDWLMNASLYQAPNPYTINPFKKDQNLPVNEIDGMPSRNFYSVLNVGQYSTEDQLLNITTFSLLYKWLSQSSVALQSSATGDGTPVFAGLLPKTVDYCFRIMDQCERKPKVPQDCDLQNACLVEVVKLLDVVCRVDSGQLAKVFPEVKRVFARLAHESAQDPSQPRILLQIIQFFLNHSGAVVYDSQPAYDLYFGSLLSQHYRHSSVAYETLQFIRENLETLCYNTNILSKFFPNVLKILAWHPRSFVAEMMDVLPAVMSPASTIEVLHAVLDLPCICAAMEVSRRAQNGEVTPPAPPGGDLSSLQAFSDPIYSLMFKFILRAEGGCGDTISRLKELHGILGDQSELPRVIVCGQVVPVLLRVFFTVVLEEGDEKLANQLLPVILERAGLLFTLPEYQTDVRRILAESLYDLLRAYPSLVVDQFSEIMEHVTSTRNITDRELLFSHLVWGIGEYASGTHDKRCTPEMISKYYESLEALTYEISGLIQSASSEEASPFSPRLLTILIAALAKLSSRCQDLIPRVLLCLTKVSQQQAAGPLDAESRGAVVGRAAELVSLLKLPNFASVILNPPKEIETGSWHKDHTSEAVILRTTHRILRPDM